MLTRFSFDFLFTSDPLLVVQDEVFYFASPFFGARRVQNFRTAKEEKRATKPKGLKARRIN